MAHLTHPGRRIAAGRPPASRQSWQAVVPLATRPHGPLRRSLITAASSGGSGGDPPSPSPSPVPDALPVAGPDTDWRAYRARLAAMEAAVAERPGASGSGCTAGAGTPPAAQFSSGKWAHALPVPETGAVLLAHPSMFGASQTYFRLASILLLEVNEQGALGIILNRPTEHSLRDLQFSSDAPVDGVFRANRLWMGGDVGDGSVVLITSCPGVDDASQIAAGIWACTVQGAVGAVQAGKARPQDFRFFARYAGWGPGQLERECKAGVWFVASVCSQLVMDEQQAAAEGDALWHDILRTMGGPHAELSDIVLEQQRKQGVPPPPWLKRQRGEDAA